MHEKFSGVNKVKALQPRPGQGKMLKAEAKAEAMVSFRRLWSQDHFGFEDLIFQHAVDLKQAVQ